MSVPVRVAILFASFWVSGCVFGDLLLHDALAPYRPPQPTPRETPWLWVDTAPDGGACYVFGDTLGPCFTKPSPEAP